MNDPLDPLLSSLRHETNPRAERTAFGLESRVLARLRDDRAFTLLWFKRWSVGFGIGTAACAGLLVHTLDSLSASGLDAALAGQWILFGWL